MDYLAIAVAELANISERRIERCVIASPSCGWWVRCGNTLLCSCAQDFPGGRPPPDAPPSLNNGAVSGLPPFLVDEGGLNSGFMSSVTD